MLDVSEHNGVSYIKTYFALGGSAKAYYNHPRARFTSKDGPANGWCGVLYYDEGDGAITLFCPSTFKVIPRDKRDPEITESKATTFDPDLMATRIERKIAEYKKLSISVDYVVANRFLCLLTGREIEAVDMGGDSGSRGAVAASEALKRPIRPGSQTAQIVEQLLSNPDINLAEKKLRKTRQQIMGCLNILANTHGFGYSISKTSAVIELPQDQLMLEDCIKYVPRARSGGTEKPIVNAGEIEKVKKNSKRGKVLLNLLTHKSISRCERDMKLKRNNIFSLLYLLQTQNGIEYETARKSDAIKITLPCELEEIWR